MKLFMLRTEWRAFLKKEFRMGVLYNSKRALKKNFPGKGIATLHVEIVKAKRFRKKK